MTRFKTFDEAAAKPHPSDVIHHEIIWWITRPMTLKEWFALDEAMYDAFETAGLGGDQIGIAGPMPAPKEDE
jgi:hypothetical protein